MYLPTVSLVATSTASVTVAHLPGPDARAAGNTLDNNGYPSGSAVSLVMGQYTLFNFWRDWAVYEKQRLQWLRSQEVFAEAVRQVRFSVTLAFFRMRMEQEKLDASKRSITISESIVELVKSRQRLGQATDSDVSSSYVDLLNAKNSFESRLTFAKQSLWQLNILLGDPIDSQYKLQDSIKYMPVKLTPEQAIKLYYDQAPATKQGKVSIRSAELDLGVAQKNRLPLPTVRFGGLTVGFQNNYYGAKPTYYGSNQPNGSALDVSATVSLTLPLVGSGGLLNARNVEQTLLSLESAEVSIQNQRLFDESQIYQALAQLRENEQTIENQKQSLERSASLLDSLFSKLSNKFVSSRLELRDAIAQARDAEIALAEAQINHLGTKLSLSALIGTDLLPGEIP